MAASAAPSAAPIAPEPAKVVAKQPTGLGVGVGVLVLVGEGEGVGVPAALAVAPGEEEALGVADQEGVGHCKRRATLLELPPSVKCTTPDCGCSATPRG